jgi:ribosomal protein S18 acetylase RimI-like enzyme
MASGVRGDAPGAVELISMWVRPEARGRGVGDRLMRAVEDDAVRAGATTLRLSVMPDNQQATALYLRSGFSDTGEVGDVRPDGITRERVLVKSLGPTSGARDEGAVDQDRHH